MMTKTRLVAQLLMAQGRGTYVFNDRLVDDRRSLKVWGWGQSDYVEAKQMLEQAGCQVELVQFTARSPRSGQRYSQTRLHVTE